MIPLDTASVDAASLVDDLGVGVPAHYGDPEAEVAAFFEGAALVDRSCRGAVRVTGADARSFLQSLVSQDIADLVEGTGAHALLLEPRGKLDVDMRVLQTGPEQFDLTCEVGMGSHLAASLRRFKIRVDAEIEDRSALDGCIAVRGPRAPEVVEAALGVHVPGEQHSQVRAGDLWVVHADERPDLDPGPPAPVGVDVVGARPALEAAWPVLRAAGALPAGFLAFETVRIAAGAPRQGYDLDSTTIAQEAALERDAVSFTKGCFLGQELVCRIDTRGHVNRYLRGLAVDAGTLARWSDAKGREVRLGDTSVGQVTSVAPIAAQEAAIRALALVRREVEPGSQVEVVATNGPLTATVLAL